MEWNAIFTQIFGYSEKSPWFFTEYSFLLTFGCFLVVYAFLVNQNFWKKIYLISFSLFFYYKSSGPFLLLFGLMIVSDYFFAQLIAKQEGKKRKIFLLLSLIYSLSFLLYFKYSGFVIEGINNLFDTHFAHDNLFLPIGISFYTFQSISYLLDVYRKEIPASKDFSDYAFYMTFFPHLVAGPIVRARDFLPQIANPMVINGAVFKEGILRVIIGLFKKLFIADYLAKYVDIVHAAPKGYGSVENLFSMYAYSFQIYFDFSGYSDIAIGIALLLGYRLRENFENPYTAQNITQFWRKWHISLSEWLRDYIYIPLGGNRKGVFNMYLFLLITMLVGGLWHGASFRFIFWGGAHGLALAVHKLLSKYNTDGKKNAVVKVLSIFITFHFVALCWIFFRATSFENAFDSIIAMFTNFNGVGIVEFFYSRPEIIILLVIASVIVFFPPKWKEITFQSFYRIPSYLWVVILLIILQVIIQFKDDNVQNFIYFQF